MSTAVVRLPDPPAPSAERSGAPPAPLRSLAVTRPYPASLRSAALVFFLLSANAILVGAIYDLGWLLFPLAGVAGLAAYACAARWVARLPRRNRVTRFLERVRLALAYEG